jgi:hypothetical protein
MQLQAYQRRVEEKNTLKLKFNPAFLGFYYTTILMPKKYWQIFSEPHIVTKITGTQGEIFKPPAPCFNHRC